MTETIEIGDFFPEADKQRVTTVQYQGQKYEVQEQYWETGENHPPKWQVSFHLGAEERQENVDSTEELVANLARQVEKINVIRRLDYTLQTMSDGNYVIYSKDADESGLEVEEHD